MMSRVPLGQEMAEKRAHSLYLYSITLARPRSWSNGVSRDLVALAAEGRPVGCALLAHRLRRFQPPPAPSTADCEVTMSSRSNIAIAFPSPASAGGGPS